MEHSNEGKKFQLQWLYWKHCELHNSPTKKQQQKTILLSPICMRSEWPGNHRSYNYPQHEFHTTHLHVLKQLEMNIGFHPSNILLPSLICSSLSLWISFLKCFPKTYRNFPVPHQCSLSSSVVRTRQKEESRDTAKALTMTTILQSSVNVLNIKRLKHATCINI